MKDFPLKIMPVEELVRQMNEANERSDEKPTLTDEEVQEYDALFGYFDED